MNRRRETVPAMPLTPLPAGEERFTPGAQPPDDLCAEHKRIWKAWQKYARSYDSDNPREYGGGHIMDSRTSHAHRRRDWILKGIKDLDLTEQICRRGSSPQCTPKEATP